MHSTIATLKNALAYAKFTDEDVKDATFDLVEKLGDDLEERYEPGSLVEQSQANLEGVLDTVDSGSEEIEGAIRNADLDDEDEDDEVEDKE